MMLCLMIMEVVLMRKSAASGRKWTWFPVLPGLLLLGWNLCHILGMPFIKAYVGDMTAVCCFLMAAIYQSSIICGLIPINSRYIELFQAAGGLDAEITDWSFKKCYHSGKFLDIPQEVRETLLVGTLVIENGTRMNHLLVRGGHLFWAEDVSLLMDQYQDIEELSRTVVVELIRQIRVYDKKNIEITFDFDDCYQTLLNQLSAMGVDTVIDDDNNLQVKVKEVV